MEIDDIPAYGKAIMEQAQKCRPCHVKRNKLRADAPQKQATCAAISTNGKNQNGRLESKIVRSIFAAICQQFAVQSTEYWTQVRVIHRNNRSPMFVDVKTHLIVQNTHNKRNGTRCVLVRPESLRPFSKFQRPTWAIGERNFPLFVRCLCWLTAVCCWRSIRSGFSSTHQHKTTNWNVQTFCASDKRHSH